ncbi:hypothetical protein NPIL_378191 [Nephila pilipes]|uniref:Uncharacterized protein n=1 Tax=Nephila pilipes TaxID=299642 RepID=A0A8X6JXH2_NEPPI|nr:hypothetical protein NPIL_378191 [Nephila pilipes]
MRATPSMLGRLHARSLYTPSRTAPVHHCTKFCISSQRHDHVELRNASSKTIEELSQRTHDPSVRELEPLTTDCYDSEINFSACTCGSIGLLSTS